MGTIRVLLADDHAVVRKGIREFLEEDPEIQVIGEAKDGLEAQHLIQQLQPDVVIADVRMPRRSGIDLAAWIRRTYPEMKVLVLTAYDDDPYIVEALNAGANGYLLKTASPDELIAAVRAVYQGQSALDPQVAQKLLHYVSRRTRPAVIEPLTPREKEVLQLAAMGLTNRAIGQRLGISDRTVQGHLANIYEKLQVNSRTEAVTKALQLGLIQLPDEL